MKKYWSVAMCIAVVTLFAAGAMAQFAKPDEAVAYRKAMMVLIGSHFGQLGAVVKGEMPFEKEAVQKNTQLVGAMTRFSWDSFLTAGSDKGDTRIKSSALETPDQFRSAVAAFKAEVENLSKVVEDGDEAAFKARFGAAAQSCKACHGSFRK